MWNFFIRRDTRKKRLEPATNLGSRARRRRRPLFAGAEPLEPRALLSATGSDSSIDLADNVPVEIVVVDQEESKAHFANDATAIDWAGLPIINRVGDLVPSSNFSDELFASIASTAPRTPMQGASVGKQSNGLGSIFSGSMSNDSEPTVELRVAETGQLIAVGSASAVQDSNGLTINDDSSPMTYLRTTDAEGRVQSKLAFVTRTNRAALVSEPQTPMTSNEVIVAEADISDESISEDLTARPDLHDFETALEAASQATSPTSLHESSPQILAAASRTRWATATRVASANDRELQATTDVRREAASGRLLSLDAANNELDTDSDEFSAMPVFDPTTRNVVVSVCLLGSLARATARRRRRLKALIAP